MNDSYSISVPQQKNTVWCKAMGLVPWKCRNAKTELGPFTHKGFYIVLHYIAFTLFFLCKRVVDGCL